MLTTIHSLDRLYVPDSDLVDGDRDGNRKDKASSAHGAGCKGQAGEKRPGSMGGRGDGVGHRPSTWGPMGRRRCF